MGIWQIILLSFFGITLLVQANQHGKPKEGKENFWYTAIAVIIELIILYFGGFF